MAGAAVAGEYAILTSGSRLHIDRHEAAGATIKLFIGAGTVELDSSAVSGFEAEDTPALTAAAPASETPTPLKPLSPEQMADAAARRYGLPEKLIRSVMKRESGFHPQAVSPKGAVGLMQLMPSTAQALGANAQDPSQNVDAGARYLRQLLEKYQGGLRHALAAYNAGPGAVDKYKGVPPFPETLDYVQRVEQDWAKKE